MHTEPPIVRISRRQQSTPRNMPSWCGTGGAAATLETKGAKPALHAVVPVCPSEPGHGAFRRIADCQYCNGFV
ncbi:hypothetical protein WJX77_002279 [Trebouxia sp. C0004]